MLRHLTIENYALIEELSIDFHKGFSVITGETGAGKSILLGALSLILGQRADTQVLYNKEKKCIVEGTFFTKEYQLDDFFKDNQLDYDGNTILRREINPQGKSRAFINDTPVNLLLLKELGDRLVDIHSQHKTITINNSSIQLAMLDSFVGHVEIVKQYQEKFLIYSKLKKQLAEITATEQRLKAEQEYHQFLYDELCEAKIVTGEQQATEKEIELLNNTETIKQQLFNASQALSDADLNIIQQLSELTQSIEKLSSFHEAIKELSIRLKSNVVDLKDIADEMSKINETFVYDPKRIEYLNARIDTIYSLEQKHKVSTEDDLLKIQEDLQSKLQKVESIENSKKTIEKELNSIHLLLKDLSEKISKNRQQSFAKLEKELIALLVSLGMPNAQFKIKHEVQHEFTDEGVDKITFLFNANKGGEMRELSKIASGGELSRLMLAIKSLISQKNLLPTILFDEIDTGVSGEVAMKVGSILHSISKFMQVISITHLPQIAGKSTHHYFVYKETDKQSTRTYIKELNSEERITEIAKMLGGEKLTSAKIETAKELLKN